MDFQALQSKLTTDRIFYAADVVLILLCAWLAGSLCSSIIENQFLAVPIGKAKFAAPAAAGKDRRMSVREFQSVLKNNVFNVIVETDKPAKVAGTSAGIRANPGARIKSVISGLKLNGTVLWGKTTFGLLMQTTSQKEEVYGIGDEVFDTGARIVKLEENKAWLRTGSETGILEYQPPKTPRIQIKSAASPTNTVSENASRRTEKSYEQNITRRSETEFHFRQKDLDGALNDMPTLLMQARVVPYMIDGSHQGFLIKKINKGSLYEKLGLKNDDVIKRVNGEELDSLAKVMGLLPKFRTEREIVIEIVRNGNPLALTYFVS